MPTPAKLPPLDASEGIVGRQNQDQLSLQLEAFQGQLIQAVTAAIEQSLAEAAHRAFSRHLAELTPRLMEAFAGSRSSSKEQSAAKPRHLFKTTGSQSSTDSKSGKSMRDLEHDMSELVLKGFGMQKETPSKVWTGVNKIASIVPSCPGGTGMGSSESDGATEGSANSFGIHVFDTGPPPVMEEDSAEEQEDKACDARPPVLPKSPRMSTTQGKRNRVEDFLGVARIGTDASSCSHLSSGSKSMRDLEEDVSELVLKGFGMRQETPSKVLTGKKKVSLIVPSSLEGAGMGSCDSESLEEDSAEAQEDDQVSDAVPTCSYTGMSTAQIMRNRVEELAGEFVKTRTDITNSSSASQVNEYYIPLALRLSGIAPWSMVSHRRVSLVYKGAILVLSSCCFLAMPISMLSAHGWLVPDMDSDDGRFSGLCMNQLLSAGAVAGLVLSSVGRRGQNLIDSFSMLHTYASRCEVLGQWSKMARREQAIMLLSWLIALGCQFIEIRHAAAFHALALLDSFVLAVTTGILMCIVLYLSLICRALFGMVDVFCCSVFDHCDLAQAIHNWNMLQAMTRKASMSAEACFVNLLIVVACAAPLAIVDVSLRLQQGAWLAVLPGVLTTLSIMRVFVLAGSVTDKCSRVPALITSLDVDKDMMCEKQQLIEHIINSAAGFYVWNTRLTTKMTLKFLYIWTMIAFSLGARVLPGGAP